MKTFTNYFLAAFIGSVLSQSDSFADSIPNGRPAAVASYKIGIYCTFEDKIQIGLD